MIFLKPIMLAGLGAAVIPLVLHLLSKAWYRNVEWGAMMFLQAAAPRVRDHARLKQAALLSMRIAILGILALALARPVLQARSASSGDDARIHAIIILDRSASMGIADGSRTRLASAKQAVINFLSHLRRGDEASLILTGDPVDPGQAQPSGDLQALAARVGALAPSYGRANMSAALEQARQALAREPGVTHELYVVCDRQAVSWESLNERFLATWQETIEKLDSPLRFFVIPAGGEESDNVAIESIELPGPPVVRDMPAEVQIRVRNFGGIPRSNLPIELIADGRSIAELSLNLAPDSVGMTKASVKFAKSGSQVLSAQMNSGGLRVDDRMSRAIHVLEPIRVLIITSEMRNERERSSADIARLALMPHALAGAPGVDPAVVRIIGADDWWGISPDRDDVVILSNVGPLSDDQVRQVEQFIYAGGAVIFAPGNLIDVESCNSDLYREGEGFLPISIKPMIDQPIATRLQSVETAHPIFQFMRGRPDPLPDAPITQYIEPDDRSADSKVLATLANGNPFLIERPYGRGRVLMFTTSLGGTWNALPVTDLYLPLLQSAIRHLAGATVPDRNLKPGEPIELSFDHQPADTVATIVLPSGQQRRVQIAQSGQRWTLRFNETIQPGQYALMLGGAAPLRYVVAAPRDESDPTPMTPQRWESLQRALNFRWLNAERESMSRTLTAQRTGKELHLPLLGIVVLLSLAEMGLARRWTRS